MRPTKATSAVSNAAPPPPGKVLAESGFDVHLVKPVDESELVQLLENGGSSSIH